MIVEPDITWTSHRIRVTAQSPSPACTPSPEPSHRPTPVTVELGWAARKGLGICTIRGHHIELEPWPRPRPHPLPARLPTPNPKTVTVEPGQAACNQLGIGTKREYHIESGSPLLLAGQSLKSRSRWWMDTRVNEKGLGVSSWSWWIQRLIPVAGVFP